MKLKRSLIPLIYFPSEIILLDDDTDFLDSTKRSFERKEFNGSVHTFDSADKAISFISKNPEPISSHCLNFNESYPGSRGFDLLNQFKIFHDKTDLAVTSLAVIDYAMPAKDGITFAKELRAIAPEVKILMLTGEADETMAINAFNEGLIDLFIKKESRDLTNALIEYSQKLVTQYFLEQTNSILANINPQEKINTPEFTLHENACTHISNLFPIGICKSFCLMDEEGTFEATLKDGTTHYFKLLSQREYDYMIEELKENLDDDDPILRNAEQKLSLTFGNTSENEATAPVELIMIDSETYFFCNKQLA